MRLKWFLTSSLYAALAAGSLAARPPSGLGTVGGQVLDSKGKPVANARVTLQAAEGSHLQTTETNSQGRFWFASLPEGQYSVRASDQSRVSEWRQNIWVSPGRQTDVTLHLRPQKSSVSTAVPRALLSANAGFLYIFPLMRVRREDSTPYLLVRRSAVRIGPDLPCAG